MITSPKHGRVLVRHSPLPACTASQSWRPVPSRQPRRREAARAVLGPRRAAAVGIAAPIQAGVGLHLRGAEAAGGILAAPGLAAERRLELGVAGGERREIDGQLADGSFREAVVGGGTEDLAGAVRVAGFAVGFPAFAAAVLFAIVRGCVVTAGGQGCADSSPIEIVEVR